MKSTCNKIKAISQNQQIQLLNQVCKAFTQRQHTVYGTTLIFPKPNKHHNTYAMTSCLA